MIKTRIHYALIDNPTSIFGSVGRCGSGYNTRWIDWSEQGRENLKNINDEWYERYDAITGHYTKLEESILKEGFRNPIVITCGKPYRRRMDFVDPHLRTKKDLLIMEGFDGGSRLWVAQKYNIPVPAIVNDRVGAFSNYPEIFNEKDLLQYYKDIPEYIDFSYRGVNCTKLQHAHLDNEYVDPENQASQIIPLWVELLRKYGYRPRVNSMHKKYLPDGDPEKGKKMALRRMGKRSVPVKQRTKFKRKQEEIQKMKIRKREEIMDEVKEEVILPSSEPQDLKSYDDIVADDWGRTAFVVGGGPSLKAFDWDLLGPDKFVVAINQSHKVLPDAQIVYFTDKKYWIGNKESLLSHNGILVKGSLNTSLEKVSERVKLMHLSGSTGIEKRINMLKHGSNSTYAVINMIAVHLGFKKIYLMGVDMKWKSKGDKSNTHWHEGYKRLTPEGAYKKMMANFATLVNPLKEMEVEVINLINPKCPSALKCFETKNLNEIFGE